MANGLVGSEVNEALMAIPVKAGTSQTPVGQSEELERQRER